MHNTKNKDNQHMENNKKRVIAIYLPQFHPFKENDEWWGKGFTEWRNVAKAKPRFKGHYQPHIPADLGFYDLRVPEVREEQAKLAQEHGIYGFCYYHYWFNGHQLMERPLKEVLKSGKPDFPFMICWANENWTRAWDGSTKKVLIEQRYSEEDDREHINYLIKNYFSDPRYIRVNGKPVFCIYRSTIIPKIENSIKIWREEAAKHNMELYICRMESFGQCGKEFLSNFDAAIEFQPHQSQKAPIHHRFLRRAINKIAKNLLGQDLLSTVIDYNNYVKRVCKRERPNYKQYPCVTPMWDNSPRRVNGAFFAFKNSNPSTYKKWLLHTLNNFKKYSEEENFVFINAWNEWAEGNHLEPDLKWGTQYLNATLEAINENLSK